MDIRTEKTYDSVFWTSIVKLTPYFIPLVNEAFGEQFTDKATITLKPMKQVTEQTDLSFEQGEVDAYAELSEESIKRDYHFELETWGDTGFAIRIAEYAAGAAYGNIIRTEHGAKMTIPYSAVIFLRNADTIPDKLLIEIDYPGGTVSYEAPVLKIRNYAIRDLFEKKLLLLLPFYSFTFDDKFKKMDAEKNVTDLAVALNELNIGLTKMVDSGELSEVQKNRLIDWSKRVLDKLTLDYKSVSEEVNKIMGGFILHTRTDEILEQGIEQGIEQGQNRIIENMLRNGKTPEEISSFAGINLDTVKKVQESMLQLA